jgi:uncharacterized C2H2 Zn-finger protein
VKHVAQFNEVRSILFPSDFYHIIQIPSHITSVFLKDDKIESPSSYRLIFEGNESRAINIYPISDSSLIAHLTDFFKDQNNLFVKPICFNGSDQFNSASLSLLVIGGTSGLAVIDFVGKPTKDGHCLNVFFENRKVLCSATRIENEALIQSNIKIISSIPASQLATLSFINYCDSATRKNPALFDLLQMKGMTFQRWPAPALSILSQIAFSLLILSFLESENVIRAIPNDMKVLRLPGYPVFEETAGIGKLPGFSPEVCELPSDVSEIVGIRRRESVCRVCKKVFRNDEDVLKHLLQGHVELQSIANSLRIPTKERQRNQCLKCREVFEKYADFIGHIVECHRMEVLKAAHENEKGVVVRKWIEERMELGKRQIKGEEEVVDADIEKWRNLRIPEVRGPIEECWF